MTHICVSKITFIGLNNGLRLAIIWTSAGILLIGPLGANFSEIFIEIQIVSSKKIHLKRSSANMAAILPQPQRGNEKQKTTTTPNEYLHASRYWLVMLGALQFLTRPAMNIAVNKIDILLARYHLSRVRVTIVWSLWRHRQLIVTSSAERRTSETQHGDYVWRSSF